MFDELIDGFVGHQLEDVVGSREDIVEPDIKYRFLIYLLSKNTSLSKYSLSCGGAKKGSFLAKPRQINCCGKSVHPSLLIDVPYTFNPCEDLTPPPPLICLIKPMTNFFMS
jgi:hypothetical protein